MVVADCESELFRDGSRGLAGGAFFMATLLNRKEAKTARGKDDIDSLKDFILLKGDVRFCQYFIRSKNLDPEVDNTPEDIKCASGDQKVAYLHKQVEGVLRELLPFFRSCKFEDPQLQDHPLQEGRRSKYRTNRENIRMATTLEALAPVLPAVVENTVIQLQTSLPDLAQENVERSTVKLSESRSQDVYTCKICRNFQNKYRTICLAHVRTCLEHQQEGHLLQSRPDDDSDVLIATNTPAIPEEKDDHEIDDYETDDEFWKYKSNEFFIDAIFGVTTTFERYGDGLGCFIINKIMLPILHGLKHSNYTNSIHRFITRVLCEATPKEALKLIHERFSNRVGKPGNNIARDRRMEYRIGTAKKLIKNLGPNFNPATVQQINSLLDIKEELFMQTRVSHGVNIRSGKHNARSDAKDYALLFSHLCEVGADKKISGRVFGDFKLKEDLMDDSKFDNVEFYRWIGTKNKEAVRTLSAKKIN